MGKLLATRLSGLFLLSPGGGDVPAEAGREDGEAQQVPPRPRDPAHNLGGYIVNFPAVFENNRNT